MGLAHWSYPFRSRCPGLHYQASLPPVCLDSSLSPHRFQMLLNVNARLHYRASLPPVCLDSSLSPHRFQMLLNVNADKQFTVSRFTVKIQMEFQMGPETGLSMENWRKISQAVNLAVLSFLPSFLGFCR